MKGARLKTAAVNLVTKCRIFGRPGSCTSPGVAHSVRWVGRKGTDICGARENEVLQLNAANEQANALYPGIGHSSRNFGGKVTDHHGARVRVTKIKASGADMYGISPARDFGGKGIHLCEARDDGFMKFEAAGEQVEEPLKVVEYLHSLRNFENEGVPKGAGTESDAGFDLQRMSRLLLRLGDPLSKYPVVHVAGTKGKGSTVSFLRHILRAAGFRVGSYTRKQSMKL